LKDFELKKKNQAQTPLQKTTNKFYNVKTKIKHTFKIFLKKEKKNHTTLIKTSSFI
jgi:hypothetical protein